MKERMIKGLQFNYVPARFSGENTSGIHPVGKRVLVMMDRAPNQSEGGIHILPEIVERMSLGSESGALIALGDESFSRHSDGTVWTGRKPKVGDRIYVDKYAGLEVMGDDGLKYRVMDDGCVGAIFDN